MASPVAGALRMPQTLWPAATYTPAISRKWLKARRSRYLREIDEIASLSKRPGAYFLNVDYEWGCTTAAKPATAQGRLIAQGYEADGPATQPLEISTHAERPIAE
jgi:hypothetical protein